MYKMAPHVHGITVQLFWNVEVSIKMLQSMLFIATIYYSAQSGSGKHNRLGGWHLKNINNNNCFTNIPSKNYFAMLQMLHVIWILLNDIDFITD